MILPPSLSLSWKSNCEFSFIFELPMFYLCLLCISACVCVFINYIFRYFLSHNTIVEIDVAHNRFPFTLKLMSYTIRFICACLLITSGKKRKYKVLQLFSCFSFLFSHFFFVLFFCFSIVTFLFHTACLLSYLVVDQVNYCIVLNNKNKMRNLHRMKGKRVWDG